MYFIVVAECDICDSNIHLFFCARLQHPNYQFYLRQYEWRKHHMNYKLQNNIQQIWRTFTAHNLITHLICIYFPLCIFIFFQVHTVVAKVVFFFASLIGQNGTLAANGSTTHFDDAYSEPYAQQFRTTRYASFFACGTNNLIKIWDFSREIWLHLWIHSVFRRKNVSQAVGYGHNWGMRNMSGLEVILCNFRGRESCGGERELLDV